MKKKICRKLGHFSNYTILVNNKVVGGTKTKSKALKKAGKYNPEKNMVQIHRYVCSLLEED